MAPATFIVRDSAGTKDDAAGLAISERLTPQIKGMGMGVRNANDGISLMQRAEGALQSVTDNLQRIRELAVQSANGTNTQSDQVALNTEAQSLIKEIDRIAKNTQFNGKNLTDGTFVDAIFQVGANADQTIMVADLSNATTAAIGRFPTFPSLPNTNTNNGAGTITSTTTSTIGGVTTITSTGTGISNLSGAGAGTLIIADADGFPYDIGALPPANSIKERMDQFVAAVNNIANTTGASAYIDTTTNAIQLTSRYPIRLSGSDHGSRTGTDTSAIAGESGPLDTLDISSYDGSRLAIQQIDGALQAVNADRSMMGPNRSSTPGAIETDMDRLAHRFLGWA